MELNNFVSRKLADEMSASRDGRIRLNVGGVRFETFTSTLGRIPNSRLEKLCKDHTNYDLQQQEYFFDRNPQVFRQILEYFRSGSLHFPRCMCGPSIGPELAYWGIPETAIAQCCWNSYQQFAEERKALEKVETAFRIVTEEDLESESPCSLKCRRWKLKFWLFLDEPNSSLAAKVWGWFFILLVTLSVVAVVLDSEQSCRVSSQPSGGSGSNETIRHQDNETNPKKRMYSTTVTHPIIQYIDLAVNVIFLLELVCKLFVCPCYKKLLLSAMTWVDVSTVFTYWVGLLVDQLYIGKWHESASLVTLRSVLALFRILRVFRLLKLGKQFVGLQMMYLAMKESLAELILLVLFISIGMIIFSTLIFYTEFDQPTTFRDIPVGFWWAIVTMTTVGYGDTYPSTALGCIVGAVCAMTGLLMTGLPIPIIASNFTTFYSYAKMRTSLQRNTEYCCQKRDLAITHLKSTMKRSMVDPKPLGENEKEDENSSTPENRSCPDDFLPGVPDDSKTVNGNL